MMGWDHGFAQRQELLEATHAFIRAKESAKGKHRLSKEAVGMDESWLKLVRLCGNDPKRAQELVDSAG